jgi:hypothetical protein
MDEQLEIPATIKFSIPFDRITSLINPEWFVKNDSEDDVVLEPVRGSDGSVHIPEKIVKNSIGAVTYSDGTTETETEEVDYLEDREILRVEGIALMPGVYVGMNGLEAQYDHDVIIADGPDLTGRPVGQMHQKDNSGYVHTTDVHEVTAELRIFTEIYDQEAIQGVKSGKYTGFSIDTKVWGYYQGSRFIVKKIDFLNGRVDLVDRPACQKCLILDASNAPISTQQRSRDDNMTKEIPTEEYESLLAAKAELEQVKIKQAAETEAKIVGLIKQIKGKHSTFSANDYLKVATTSEQKVAMLEALNEQLTEPIIVDEEAEDITPPASGTDVAQSSEPREIELSSHDVESFLAEQFMTHFNTDVGLLKGIDADFAESYNSLIPEEARKLLETAGE